MRRAGVRRWASSACQGDSDYHVVLGGTAGGEKGRGLLGGVVTMEIALRIVPDPDLAITVLVPS